MSATTEQLERNFTHRFLTSLRRINSPDSKTTTTHAAGLVIRRRSLRIKRAAYSSMARAAGSHRAWTRALLSRARSQRRRQQHDVHPNYIPPAQRRKSSVKRAAAAGREMGRAGKLRGLVPGGSRMEMGQLLEETAHYVQCLAVQVRVMQAVADHFSSSSSM
ncbi:unnamed protein product [Linum tenue]|uniref:IBH1-like N-terminal domain-containing protein n=1 Tax=Linum tenue TaxID=586396 RepID=A0AAV0N169_9ROSI|nr:unnamed protein product [Linum tenue]